MRILFVSTFQDNRGAAIAARRMRNALIEHGHIVDLLVLYGDGSENIITFKPDLIDLIKFKLRLILERIKFSRYRKSNRSYIYPLDNLGFLNLNKHLKFKYDIIHLHWINSFVDIKCLVGLSEISKHLVWSLHDAWPITGGCHIILNCERFVQGCGLCPQLSSSKLFDLTRVSIKKKIDEYKKVSNLSFTVPSSWMLEQYKNQKLLDYRSVYLIPNTIDSEIFYNKRHKKFGKVNIDKKIIGYYSCGKINYKGLNYFLDIINRLHNDFNGVNKYEVIVIGSDYRINEIPFETRYLGELKTENELSDFYNSCDAFITASEEESFGQTALESILCGTPVVAFENTGICDFLMHKKNGYLAKYSDSEDLYRGLVFVLSNQLDFDISETSEVFKYKTVSNKLTQLYNTLTKVE
jgi:glycosyltransferase involved in cell wall biosynthesis